MSTVLLSNWFPIRMYDNTDPRLCYTRIYSSTPRARVIRGLFVFLSLPFFTSLPIVSSFFSFFFLTRFYDSVHRVGRLSGWWIPRSARLVGNHSRKRGTEYYIVESRRYHREFSGSTNLILPLAWFRRAYTKLDSDQTRRIRVNDRR